MGKISESIALVVRNETAGTLDTNIADIEKFVTERIKDYSPDTYMGDADAAKKDRAELNKAKKTLGDTRRAVIDRLMQPFVDFESRCKGLEKLIDDASSKLDAIVKARENEEKDAKRKLIQAEWDSRKFDLFSLDKVFTPKWLNKTFKMADVAAEIGAIIDRTYRDLKTIEKFSSDADTLKAHYLMNLDIADTLDYGEELKKKRELAAREAETRKARVHEERIEEQKKEVCMEAADAARSSSMASLVANALEFDVEPSESEYTITVSVTEAQLLGIKNYLTMQGIEYECNELVF
ncbi:MAG: DUF1351 domain-containing protein [Treponema sp.]|nr:DUF1351 domain-containing protein [Treponema sp.]